MWWEIDGCVHSVHAVGRRVNVSVYMKTPTLVHSMVIIKTFTKQSSRLLHARFLLFGKPPAWYIRKDRSFGFGEIWVHVPAQPFSNVWASQLTSLSLVFLNCVRRTLVLWKGLRIVPDMHYVLNKCPLHIPKLSKAVILLLPQWGGLFLFSSSSIFSLLL